MTDAAQKHDFLAHCVAQTTGNPLLEEIRDRSADAALAVFRLAKNALVHAIENDAMVATAEQSRSVLANFTGEIGTGVVVTFLDDTVFVCGQLLRASRKVYEATIELGKLLARCGVSEVTFDAATTTENLLEFAGAVAAATRDPNQRKALVELNVPNIHVRKVDRALTKRTDDTGPIEAQILRLYAIALMVMRRFFESVAVGANVMPHRVKRLAQKLVVLAETGNPAVLGMSAMAHAHRDDAGRAVQSAILAVVLGRRLITNRVVLAQLAMTALMTEAGRVRVVGPERRGQLIALAEDEEMRIPPVTGVVAVGTGGINVPSALRTVVAFETTWMERTELLGPSFGGKTPLPQSSILRVVRRLLDLLAPRDATIRPLGPVDALAALAADPDLDQSLVRVLVRSVGVIPAGSVVEFETGEWAVVVGPSANEKALHLPKVRIVTDGRGSPMNPPREIDLGTSGEARSLPRVKSVIDSRRTRFNITQAFVAS